jgi:hypothetical protein
MEKFSILDRVVFDESCDVWVVIGASDSPFGVDLTLINDEGVIAEKHSSVVHSAGRVRLPSDKYEILKMYVVVDNTAPVGLGVNAVGHVKYQYARKHGDEYSQVVWEDNSFRCVTCTASPDEMNLLVEKAALKGIKALPFFEPDWPVVGTDRPMSIAFGASYEFPEEFSKLELHSRGK